MTTFLKGDSSAEITLVLAEGCDYSGKTLYLSYQGALRVFPVIEAGGTVAFSFTAKETASMSLGAYPVRVWLKGEDGGTVTIHNGAVKLRVTDCVADVRSDEAMYLDVRGGLYGIEGLPERYTDEDLRRKIHEILRRLGGTVAAFALAILPAFGATVDVQTAPKGTIYNDEQVVTNVVVDVSDLVTTGQLATAVGAIPAPDFTVSNDTLVATIEATAPAPGDYANVSNAAMSAVQPVAFTNYATRAEIDAGWWSEWELSGSKYNSSDTYTIGYSGGVWEITTTGEHWGAEAPEDATYINFRGGELIITRHRVAAPIPAKTSQLENDAGFVTQTYNPDTNRVVIGDSLETNPTKSLVCIGGSAKSTGLMSTALGFGAFALGDYSLALGGSDANGMGNQSIGFNNQTFYGYSTAVGVENVASGLGASAFGGSNKVYPKRRS